MAVAKNNVRQISQLLAQGAKPDVTLDAVYKEGSSEYEELYDLCNDLGIIDSKTTPLHIAAMAADKRKMVAMLLTAGANPHLCNTAGEMPLYTAFSDRRWAAAALLLAKTDKNLFYNTLQPIPSGLHLLSTHPNVPESIIKFLVEEWGEDINGKHFGSTVLEANLADNCSPETVQLLLNYGAIPTMRCMEPKGVEHSPEKNRVYNLISLALPKEAYAKTVIAKPQASFQNSPGPKTREIAQGSASSRQSFEEKLDPSSRTEGIILERRKSTSSLSSSSTAFFPPPKISNPSPPAPLPTPQSSDTGMIVSTSGKPAFPY